MYRFKHNDLSFVVSKEKIAEELTVEHSTASTVNGEEKKKPFDMLQFEVEYLVRA